MAGRQARQPFVQAPVPLYQGLYQEPTLINNVETLATVPAIIRMGGAQYAKLGRRPRPARRSCRSPATCSAPATTRSSSGVPSREIIYDLAGGPPVGAPSSAGSRRLPRRCSPPRIWMSPTTSPLAKAGIDRRRDHRRRRLHANPRRGDEGREVLQPRAPAEAHPRGPTGRGAADRPRRGQPDGFEIMASVQARSSATAARSATRWRCPSA